MIQRYKPSLDHHLRADVEFDDNGEYVRYADIEPLLPRWVACSERLPEERTYVLCLCQSNEGSWWKREVGCFYKDGDLNDWRDRHGCTLDPLYWSNIPSPLPPLPQEPTQ